MFVCFQLHPFGQNLQPHSFLKENFVLKLLGLEVFIVMDFSTLVLLLFLLGNGKYFDTSGMMGFDGTPPRGVEKRIQQLCAIASCQM